MTLKKLYEGVSMFCFEQSVQWVTCRCLNNNQLTRVNADFLSGTINIEELYGPCVWPVLASYLHTCWVCRDLSFNRLTEVTADHLSNLNSLIHLTSVYGLCHVL